RRTEAASGAHPLDVLDGLRVLLRVVERRVDRAGRDRVDGDNSVTSIRSLVEAGHGIHLGPLWAFEDSLGKGRVVEVLLGWRVEAYPLHVVYTGSSYVPAKIRAFADLMAKTWRDAM